MSLMIDPWWINIIELVFKKIKKKLNLHTTTKNAPNMEGVLCKQHDEKFNRVKG